MANVSMHCVTGKVSNVARLQVALPLEHPGKLSKPFQVPGTEEAICAWQQISKQANLHPNPEAYTVLPARLIVMSHSLPETKCRHSPRPENSLSRCCTPSHELAFFPVEEPVALVVLPLGDGVDDHWERHHPLANCPPGVLRARNMLGRMPDRFASLTAQLWRQLPRCPSSDRAACGNDSTMGLGTRKMSNAHRVPLVGQLNVLAVGAPTLHIFVGLVWQVACKALLLVACCMQCLQSLLAL